MIDAEQSGSLFNCSIDRREAGTSKEQKKNERMNQPCASKRQLLFFVLLTVQAGSKWDSIWSFKPF